MKRCLFSLILLFGVGQLLMAQQIQYLGGSKIYDKAEKQPEFPGGQEAFKNYTSSPIDNRLRDYYCDVELSCVVEKDGSLDKIKLLPSYPDDDCIAQAIKLLKSSPKWSPGLIAGKPVRVRLALTVSLNHTAPSFTSNKPRSKNFIYTSVEKIPNYAGGREGFDAYVKSNIRYPALALANGTQGKVIVSFVVERNGKLTDITVSRGIGDGCDEEALRLVQKTSKKWTPGKMTRGVKVRTAYSIPVTFTILESSN